MLPLVDCSRCAASGQIRDGELVNVSYVCRLGPNDVGAASMRRTTGQVGTAGRTIRQRVPLPEGSGGGCVSVRGTVATNRPRGTCSAQPPSSRSRLPGGQPQVA